MTDSVVWKRTTTAGERTIWKETQDLPKEAIPVEFWDARWALLRTASDKLLCWHPAPQQWHRPLRAEAAPQATVISWRTPSTQRQHYQGVLCSISPTTPRIRRDNTLSSSMARIPCTTFRSKSLKIHPTTLCNNTHHGSPQQLRFFRVSLLGSHSSTNQLAPRGLWDLHNTRTRSFRLYSSRNMPP